MAVPEISDAMASHEECRRVLQAVPFLDGLSDDDLAVLAQNMRAREFLAGATIFYEDDSSDGVYFLAGGAVEVFKSDQTGKKLPLVVLRDSGLIGEMGLINNTPRTATARALSSSHVLYLSSDTFYASLEAGVVPVHRLVLGFARIIAHRLASMDERLFSLFENETDNEHFRELNEFKQRLMATWTGLSIDSNS